MKFGSIRSFSLLALLVASLSFQVSQAAPIKLQINGNGNGNGNGNRNGNGNPNSDNGDNGTTGGSTGGSNGASSGGSNGGSNGNSNGGGNGGSNGGSTGGTDAGSTGGSNGGSNGSSNGGSNGGGSTGGSAVTLIYANSFIGGLGSYEGALLVGEGLQGSTPLLANSGNATEQAWVESLISGSLPPLPTFSVTPGGEEEGSIDKTYSLTLPSDWEYAYFLAKWGKAHNESDHAVWLLQGGDTLYFQLPNGLSHSEAWIQKGGGGVNVPDGGSTALLLGAGVIGLGWLGRRARK